MLGFVTAVLVPVRQAAAPVGALATFVPFAVPHAPGVGAMGAEQLRTFPPLLMPRQLHVKVVAFVTAFATVPVLHAAIPLGAALRAVELLALPHAPAIIFGAEQLALLPPFGPAQVQL